MPIDPILPNHPNKPKDPETPDFPEMFYQVVPEISKEPEMAVVIDQHQGTSNLKFSQFLEKAIEFSKNHEKKTIKLNFKTQNAVNYAVSLISDNYREVSTCSALNLKINIFFFKLINSIFFSLRSNSHFG